MSNKIKKYWLFSIVAFSGLSFALAIPPLIQRDFYDGLRRLQQDRITFCVWENSPTAQFDRLLATELASVLLLEVGFVEVPSLLRRNNEEFLQTLFIALSDECRAFMGFNLEVETLPTWVTVSRSYYRAPYVLAIIEDSYQRLADIPQDQVIGSQIFSRADYQLLAYLQSLPSTQRWRRFPYDSAEMLINHLVEGQVDAALVYGPSLYSLTNGDPQSMGIRVISTDPLSQPEINLGIALQSKDLLLRTFLDEAIVALTEDGVVDQLLQEANLPGQASEIDR